MSRIGYKGFKVNDNNQLQCKDMIYELDKEYVINGKLKLCNNGMHFCWDIKDINPYYSLRHSTICEVEILGDVLEDYDKACTNKLKILRILNKDEVIGLSNKGNDNIGYCNEGNNNEGSRNTGDNNIGDYNTGNNNKGDSNGGNGNIGNDNTGNNNYGDGNIGNGNIGNDNTGNGNVGDYNHGHNNIGDVNKGDNITGFFNTISNIGSLDNIALFNKLSGISMREFKQMEIYRIMTSEDCSARVCINNNNKKLMYSLPNFDKDIFEEVTGIEIY